MVSIETIVVGVILLVIGGLFFYFKSYFSERIVQIIMIILGVVFLLVGAYYVIMGIIPGDSLIVEDN